MCACLLADGFGGCGLEISEGELRALCDCTFDGTSALQAVDAARHLGFAKTSKQTLTINELKSVIAQGLFPIVFVNLFAIEGVHRAHALVVISVNEFAVQVHDPKEANGCWPRKYSRWPGQIAIT